MIEQNRFEECIFALCEMYVKDAPSESWMKMNKSVLDNNKVTTKQLEMAVCKYMEDNKIKDVYAIPVAGDFLDILGLKPKTLEDIATEQAELAFSMVSDFKSQYLVLFADPVTNYTIEKTFGGLAKFTFDYGDDPFNPNPEKSVWGKREFITAYKTHADMGHKKFNPIYKTGAKNGDKILFIGDTNQCNQNIAIHNERFKALENRKKVELPQIGSNLKKGSVE